MGSGHHAKAALGKRFKAASKQSRGRPQIWEPAQGRGSCIVGKGGGKGRGRWNKEKGAKGDGGKGDGGKGKGSWDKHKSAKVSGSGDTGAKGAKGTKGAKGKGAKGDKCSKGSESSKGSKGDKGSRSGKRKPAGSNSVAAGAGGPPGQFYA